MTFETDRTRRWERNCAVAVAGMRAVAGLPEQYNPDARTARLAPAAVCNVASRVLWLRAKLPELDAATQAALKPFTDPLPFEAELLSGNMQRQAEAIRRIGSL